jgi:hypothetical protein
MSEEKSGAKQDLEDARAHEEEAAKREAHERDDDKIVPPEQEGRPAPSGPQAGTLGGAS